MAQHGESKALEELVRRVQKNIFAMFSYLTDKRQDIADLTQEALLKMARNIASLKDPARFKPWLNQIVTNVFYDYVKKHARDKKIDLDNDKLLEIKDKIGCEPGEKCLFAEMEKLIKAALLNLPENLRIVIVLREYEGLSYEDISKLPTPRSGLLSQEFRELELNFRKN